MTRRRKLELAPLRVEDAPALRRLIAMWERRAARRRADRASWTSRLVCEVLAEVVRRVADQLEADRLVGPGYGCFAAVTYEFEGSKITLCCTRPRGHKDSHRDHAKGYSWPVVIETEARSL